MKTRILALALAAAACADDLPAGSLLERTRVLAISAHPAGDPTRAWPRAGEETELVWLVDGPGPLPPLSWTIAVCVADGGGCAAAPFFTAEGTGVPEVRFVAPDAERLWLFAQVVPEGEPETILGLELPVEREAANHHPRAGELSMPWSEGCQPAGEVTLRLPTTGADREAFTAGGGAQREELRVSFFATAGELEGQYRVVEPTDPDDTEVTVKWTPPTELPAEGLEVRFTAVVRDLRGGVNWTSRTLCVRK